MCRWLYVVDTRAFLSFFRRDGAATAALLLFCDVHKAVICNQLVACASCTILRRHTYRWKHGNFDM